MVSNRGVWVQITDIDAMIEEALEAFVAGKNGMALLHLLAKHWPEASGLEMSFALLNASEALRTTFQDQNAAASDLLRTQALLSADLFLLERHNAPLTARSLSRLWSRQAKARRIARMFRP